MNEKVALVTGAGRGLGLAIAEELSGAGFHVLLNVRNATSEAEELCASLRQRGGSAELATFDVRSPDSVATVRAALEGRPLSLLVNNAGLMKEELLVSQRNEDWDEIIDTNYLAPRRLTLGLLPELEASPGGVVVGVASIAGVRPRRGQGAYAVSKAMLIGWTKQMAIQCPHLRFYTVAPGPILTEMVNRSLFYQQPDAFDRVPLKRAATPEEVASLIGLMSGPVPVFRNGANIICDGGLTQS